MLTSEHNLEDLSNIKSVEPMDQETFKISDNLVVNKKGGKKPLIIVGLILLLFIVLGVFFGNKIKSFVAGGKKSVSSNISASQTPTPEPSPTPNPLVRSEWSFEVLNGSGESGLAKKISDKLKGVGYQVVKSGNADKSDYKDTKIFVKEELKEKLDLVVADLKDVVKIASYAGALKDSTASARIILGKDSI